MILSDEITAFGRVDKTHGIHGEMSVSLYPRAIDIDIDVDAMRCVVLDIDGIYVPFFVKGSRQRGNGSLLLMLDGVDTDGEASSFTGKEIFALNNDLDLAQDEDSDYLTLDDMPGYIIVDSDGTVVGTIGYVDDSTENVLFEVTAADGKAINVPAAEQLITDVDVDKKILYMNLPIGIY